MSKVPADALDAAQMKRLAALSEKTGYSVEYLIWDAVNYWLETKALAIKDKVSI